MIQKQKYLRKTIVSVWTDTHHTKAQQGNTYVYQKDQTLYESLGIIKSRQEETCENLTLGIGVPQDKVLGIQTLELTIKS